MGGIGNIVTDFGDAVTGGVASALPKTRYANADYRLLEVGYPSRGVGAIPNEYQIKIHSAGMKVMVIGAMQDEMGFSVTSEWKSLSSDTPTGLSAATQFVTDRSLVSTFASRRLWNGTSPVAMKFDLVFESITDTYRNVVAPTIALMRMAMPSKDSKVVMSQKGGLMAAVGNAVKSVENKVLDAGFFLKQPGPDPFNSDKGDHITVSIGKHMEFNNVIVHTVNPSWDYSRVDDLGWPMRSKVSVDIQTYEIMTRESMMGAIT
jgi:hypothetical protein